MTANFRIASATVLLAGCIANAAHADVSAQDVWSDWRAYITGTGYEISATEQMSGNTLTIRDLILSAKMPDDEGAMTVSLGDVVFTENGDGTVRVGVPPTIPMLFSGTGEDGKAFEARVDYSQSGFSMVVSGVPDDMNYNYTSATVKATLSELTADGVAIGPDDMHAEFSMRNVIGSNRMQLSDLRSYSQRISADAMGYDLLVNDAETGEKVTIKGGSQNILIEGGADIPDKMDTGNLDEMLAAGFAADAAFSYDTGSTSMTVNGSDENMALDMTSESGSAFVALDSESVEYDVSQNGVTINVVSQDLPFPIALTMAESAGNMLIPVSKSDEEQEFSFGLTLGDFTMSDMIWSIFDPTEALPRDPATIVMDIVGKTTILANFLDPNVATGLEHSDNAPAQLNALTLNELLLSFAGATLSGSGDFTFDNSNTAMFGGMPAPQGAVDLKLIGGNGLLDRLVQIGILPEDQAMGARMMMGLFAVPGEAEDTLNSRIEINDQGHILANGQRIQ